ncbi:Putative adhesin [Lentzea albidocapillata subsp. violacea]|uniref:Putative adhesin n=1 Tax=Lentzea albidocapillata subsp. violacea TaxID=128104 RepID=A0A1G9UUI1_9PSEU|nr:Putative adhesin [Lentzea albidocapillata subsp. violacea]
MHTITHSGRVDLALDVAHGSVEVWASESYEDAQIVLSPLEPSDTEAARLIADVAVTESGDRLSVRLPRPRGASSGGMTVVRSGRGVVVSQTFGDVHFGGTVVGATIVNGQIVSGGGVFASAGGVRVQVRLPLGSTLSVESETASVVTTGSLPRLRFRSTSGDLTADRVDLVDVDTTSGDVSVAYVRTAHVHTISGDVELGASDDVVVNTTSGDVDVAELVKTAGVRSVSGDISVHAVAPSSVDANSVSGDIRISAERGVLVASNTRTVSGRVRNRTERA